MADNKPGDGEGRTANRKARQPLTRHPLFPAIVAIWFGALFGLGSLAVRPSLLEDLVVASRLDLIFASAAPPLGMTARILLALILTGIGGLIGATIARRLGRTPSAPRERKRGAASVLGRKTPAGEPARKRPLTIAEQPRDEFTDFAPLPGGAQHIADVPSLLPQNASEPEIAVPQFTLSRKSATFADGDRSPPPPLKIDELDLGQFGSDDDHTATIATDIGTPPRFNLGPVPGSFAVQSSRPFAIPPAAATEEPVDAPVGPNAEQFAARFAERSATAPRLFDGPGVPSDGQPKSAQFAPVAAAPVGIEALRNTCLHQLLPDDTAAPDAPATVDATLPSSIDPRPVAVLAAAAELGHESHDARPASMNATAAQRIASTDLGALSQVELLERLALAMQARRARQTPVAVTSQIPAQPMASAAEPVGAVKADQPIVEVTPPPPVPMPSSNAAAPFRAPVQPAMPAALRPLPLEDFDFDDALPSFVPPRQINLSTSFGAPSHDRPFAPPPSPLATPPSLAVATAEVPADTSPDEEQDAADEESRALEDGYSSLLSLSRPAASSHKSQFVRIEEPEPENSVIEPVVIFPSQTTRFADVQSAPVAAPPASPALSAEPRPFDAPGSQSSAPATAQTSEDTERALRAALASLQRMSGAA